MFLRRLNLKNKNLKNAQNYPVYRNFKADEVRKKFVVIVYLIAFQTESSAQIRTFFWKTTWPRHCRILNFPAMHFLPMQGLSLIVSKLFIKTAHWLCKTPKWIRTALSFTKKTMCWISIRLTIQCRQLKFLTSAAGFFTNKTRSTILRSPLRIFRHSSSFC